MANKAPGKAYRKGLSLVEIMRMFPDDATVERWFADARWPNGPACPHCGSEDVQSGAAHPTMPYRCRECRRRFSVRTGTVMQASHLGFQVWAIAIYLTLTSLKSVSSMKLHRDLNITQKSAWPLAHRLRKAYAESESMLSGPVEADETYFGGKRRNMGNAKQVRATVVERTDKATLQGFVMAHTAPEATVYTDEAAAYEGLPFAHESVKHTVSEHVRDKAHTNGVESFRSMLKRAHKGTFHKISPKHLNRSVTEFAGKHSLRETDTADRLAEIAIRLDGKRLRYRDLIAPNGLDSGARLIAV